MQHRLYIKENKRESAKCNKHACVSSRASSAGGLEVTQIVVLRPRDHEQKMDKEHGKCDFFGKYTSLEDELPSGGCTLLIKLEVHKGKLEPNH